MVKIVERSEEEKKKKQRISKLIQIANESLEGKFKANSSIFSGISLFKEPYETADHSAMYVSLLGENEILVKNPNYLDTAIKLAEAYEKSGEPEFTVKKDYDE